jgi:queuine/archaeosine tRNA-ribosyltransferase
VDDDVKGVVREIAETLRSKLTRPTREKVVTLLKKNNGIVKELSRVGVEITLNRLSEMLDYAAKLGFNGLVPVIQGLFKDDIEYCVRETIRLVSQVGSDWLIAVGTGGRVLSHDDTANVVFAIRKIREYARKYSVNVRIHVLGWSSPDTLPPFIVGEIYSADSLTPRKRAVEGKIYINTNGELILKRVSEVRDYSCNCPACSRPELRKYVLEQTSRRRTDVRLVHNTFMLMSYINKRMYQLGTWVA